MRKDSFISHSVKGRRLTTTSKTATGMLVSEISADVDVQLIMRSAQPARNGRDLPGPGVEGGIENQSAAPNPPLGTNPPPNTGGSGDFTNGGVWGQQNRDSLPSTGRVLRSSLDSFADSLYIAPSPPLNVSSPVPVGPSNATMTTGAPKKVHLPPAAPPTPVAIPATLPLVFTTSAATATATTHTPSVSSLAGVHPTTTTVPATAATTFLSSTAAALPAATPLNSLASTGTTSGDVPQEDDTKSHPDEEQHTRCSTYNNQPVIPPYVSFFSWAEPIGETQTTGRRNTSRSKTAGTSRSVTKKGAIKRPLGPDSEGTGYADADAAAPARAKKRSRK